MIFRTMPRRMRAIPVVDDLQPLHLLPWEPVAPEDLTEILGTSNFNWALAGGHALERFVGRTYREHEDLDAIVFRDELPRVREALREWELYAADPPGTLRLWNPNELLPPNVHDIWCRRPGDRVWRFQLMVIEDRAEDVKESEEKESEEKESEEKESEEKGSEEKESMEKEGTPPDGESAARAWVYRRDSRISGPRRKLIHTLGGLPCLRPEIQLLYKAKAPRPKDELDFEMCCPLLGPDPRKDLQRWLELLYGEDGHPWQTALRDAPGPHLRTLSPQDEPAFREMAVAFARAGENRFDRGLEDYRRYLKRLGQLHKDGQPPGRVPPKSLFLWQGPQIVGACRLRLELNERLMEEGGHIGYQIRPDRRGQGFGREILRLTLLESDEHGIDPVRITCDDDNFRSARIIEGQGGILDDKGVSTLSGKLVRRYWIERNPVT